MTTLVGRRVWHQGAVLRAGIVRAQRFNPDNCDVELDGPAGEMVTLPSICLLLTPSDALEACEEAENYWRRKAIDLREREDVS